MELKLNSVSSGTVYKDYSTTRRLTVGHLIGEGGFGSVYHCDKIDGLPNSNLVIKILHDSEDGKKGFETAKKLQDKLSALNQVRNAKGEKPLKEVSALLGAPLFCFDGIWKGQSVKGYCMFDLVKLGYVPFDSITDSKDLALRQVYTKLAISSKLRLARSLVAGFRILSELYFVHADINPQNLFVNLKTHDAAIIDFDSGAIMDGMGEKPTTLGRVTEGEWLAPEILEQIALTKGLKKTVRISLLTDYWSIAVAVHYLLFLRGPYFFLRVLGKQAVLGYLSKYQWYDAGPDHSAVDTTKLLLHANYAEYIADLPKALVERMRKTFNEGFSKPAVRTSSSQWETTLASILDAKPVIHRFEATSGSINEGQAVGLTWAIEDEYRTFLDGVDVTGTNEFETTLDETTEFLLESKGLGGATVVRKLLVKVQKFPRIFSFGADSTDVGEGATVRLHWDAKYHRELRLNGELIRGNQNSKVVSPVGPFSEYVLSSENEIGNAVSPTIVVRVHKPPVLHKIWSDRSALTSDDPLTIFWDVIRADEVEIVSRQLVGNRYQETSVTVAAAPGKHVVYLAFTTEITCIAKSRYGSSKVGGLHVDVVPMPKYQFEFSSVSTLPTMEFAAFDKGMFQTQRIFEQNELGKQVDPELPPQYAVHLERQGRKYAYFVVFCVSLAAVSGMLGYFLAINP